ncbi:unnamed protein product [Closterium sp. NIES-54]
MYALTDSAEGDCYLSVPPDPGIDVAALGTSASAASGTGESASPGAESTTLTPLSRPVAVSLADPSGGLVVAHSSTVLPCPAAPSGLLSGLHLPSFSTNLVSGADLQDTWTLTTAPPPVTASGQVVASSQVFAAASRSSPASAPCSCRPPSHRLSFGTIALVTPPCLVFERYFLLVVDDYSRYTTVFPLRSKGEVLEGIRQTFTRPASPQQNGIAERRIGMVMDVARTSMIHAAAPHFLWPFAVQYAAHQINLQPHVSLPETTPTLRQAVLPCRSLHLPWLPPLTHPGGSSTTPPRVVFSPLRTSRLTNPLPPQGPAPSGVSRVDTAEPVEVAVDSGAARGAEPVGAGTGGAEPGGAEPERVESEVAELERVEFGGVEPKRVEPGGAEPERVEPGGAEPGGNASGGAEPARAESRGSAGVPLRQEPLSPQRLSAGGAVGAGAAGGAVGAGAAGGATGAGAVGAAGPGGARTGGTGAAGAGSAAGIGAARTRAAGAGATRGAAGAGATGGAAGAARGAAGDGAAGAAGRGGACTGGTGAAGAGGVAGGGTTGTGAGGAAGAITRDPRAEGTSAVSGVSTGTARLRPYYVPLLEQVLGPTPPLMSPPPVQSQSPTERPEPESRPVSSESRPASPESRSESPIRTVRAERHILRPRPPPVPGTHSMTLRPSTAPQRVPLPSPPASSLPDGLDPESDSLRAASPTVMRFLATTVTGPLFESTAASALSASASVCPPSVKGESTLGTDVLEDRQEEFECFAASVPPLVSMLLTPEGDPDAPDIPTLRSYAEAIEGPYSSQWQAAMDAEKASWKSTGAYVDEVPPPGANIVRGMWIFRVKRPPGSPLVFKARYVARGFSQRQGVDFFQTFSPTPKMTTLRVLLHVAAQRDYELHSLDFSTAFLQGSLHEEIWLRHPPGFTGSFPAGTQWSLRRPVYGLRQAPREWHDTLKMTLAALHFAPSTTDPSLFLRTHTTLPPFYVLVYVDDLVFATADTEALAHVKSELQKRHTCTDLGPSALRLRVLLATVHSSAYRLLALSSTFGRVCRAEWPISRACGLPHVPDDLHTT